MKQRQTDADIRVKAEAEFKRLIGYTFVAAILMVVAVLFYLKWNDALSVASALVVSLAVFLSVMLGAGLMAMGFFSANSGYDERASGKSSSPPPAGDPDE